MKTSAVDVIIALIPIVGIMIGGTLVFFSLLWHHRERTLQIKTGRYEKIAFDLEAFSLLGGLLLTAIGAVLSLFFLLLTIKNENALPSLLGGLLPLAVGISLLIFHRGQKKRTQEKDAQ